MQVTICANMKGMKIKPGSLGKAVPPYDVQVCWYTASELSCNLGYVHKGNAVCVLVCHSLVSTQVFHKTSQSSNGKSFLQIIDDHGTVVPVGKEGNIAIRVQPERPFCMFSEYLVSLT